MESEEGHRVQTGRGHAPYSQEDGVYEAYGRIIVILLVEINCRPGYETNRDDPKKDQVRILNKVGCFGRERLCASYDQGFPDCRGRAETSGLLGHFYC